MHDNGLKILLWISGVSAGAQATICMLRLCMELEWPVVVKYKRWEYGIKVVGGLAWVIWVGIILEGLRP